MKINGFLFLILAIGLILGSVAIYAYVQAMSPVWADIAQKQAQQDLDTKKQNDEIQIHEEIKRAADWTEVQRMVLVIAVLGLGGWVFYLIWERRDRRKESWARAVDGTFALQTVTNGETVWVVDPNKLGGDAVGLNKSTGLLGEHASQFLGPDRQLTQNLAIQKTRTVTAASSQPIKYAAHAKMLSGAYDREPRQLAKTPAIDDVEAITEPMELLTLKQAVAQSTPEAWIIGQNQETGKLAYFKPNEAIHLAILGATGTGKTSSTGMTVVGYALKNGWRVSILDGKNRGDDWSKFSRWCEHTWIDSSNFANALKPIKAEYDRRSELLRFENPPKLQPLLVMIEEYGDINDGLTGKAKEAANSILDTLVRKARDTEIHLCFIDQYPEKWEQQLLNNTKSKVVYWLNDGAIVKEHKIYTLAEKGEFMLKGQKYASWYVKPMVKAFLSDVPAVQYPPLSVRPSVEDDGGSIPLVADKRTDGQADITDLQAAVLQWRRDNPEGSQADCRRAMEAIGLTLSRQYASDLWKIELDASPMAWQEDGNVQE